MDIDKLIRGAFDGIEKISFSSLMDIDKLILVSIRCIASICFSSLMDIDKLIRRSYSKRNIFVLVH